MIQLDMTDVSDLGVTIDGHAFRHRFAIATLPFSGYIHCEVVQGGESFEALQTTLINAIAAFEGVPELIQTDSLSAAYRNLLNDPEQDATKTSLHCVSNWGVYQSESIVNVPMRMGARKA